MNPLLWWLLCVLCSYGCGCVYCVAVAVCACACVPACLCHVVWVAAIRWRCVGSVRLWKRSSTTSVFDSKRLWIPLSLLLLTRNVTWRWKHAKPWSSSTRSNYRCVVCHCGWRTDAVSASSHWWATQKMRERLAGEMDAEHRRIGELHRAQARRHAEEVTTRACVCIDLRWWLCVSPTPRRLRSWIGYEPWQIDEWRTCKSG